LSLLLVGGLPVLCCSLSPYPVTAVFCILGFALPRLLWRQGDVAEGTKYVAALAVYWNLVMASCFLSPLLVAYCCWSRPRPCIPAALMYLLWARYLARSELKDGSAWAAFSRQEWGFHAFRRFMRLRLHLDEKLMARPAHEPVVLAVHPHGVASDYRILVDGLLYEAMPERRVLVLSASVLFCLPLVRELALWTRCIDARKSVAARALQKGNSLMVIPGGEHEQIRTVTGREEVFLSTRFGFVKLALEAKAALVPCYAFGCVDQYDTYPHVLHGPRESLRKAFGVCIPLYRGLVGFLPKRVPVNLVFGAPLELPICSVPGAPSDAEVVAAHAIYVKALQVLFDAEKGRFGYGDRQLAVS
ncbi:unnamed protein product, partial [Polarella glacialis]